MVWFQWEVSRFQSRAARLAVLGMSVAVLGGCQPEPRATGEAVLETADVQGISFNDPAPATGAASAEDAAGSRVAGATAAARATATSGPAAAAPVVTITAESTAADIASIPSATPVPTPEATATPAAPEAEVPPATTQVAAGDFSPISFKVLSGFKYVEPIPGEGDKPEDVEKRRNTDQIPADVKALNGKNAVVEGWMVPMDVAEDGSVKSFVLVKTQPQCCFGDMQAMNEWVDVTMKGRNAEFNVDMPMKVYGQLEVGEKMEDGFVLSIYRMKADRVEL